MKTNVRLKENILMFRLKREIVFLAVIPEPITVIRIKSEQGQHDS